jgi:hypothetical protein
MPINDILTPVDIIPGLSDASRQGVAALPRDGNNSSSEYQRALSRTLSSDDPVVAVLKGEPRRRAEIRRGMVVHISRFSGSIMARLLR